MAPEVILQQEGHDKRADVWSLGIMILEICEGKAPYQNLSAQKVLELIINSDAPVLSKKYRWSSEIVQFTRTCLEKNPY
jgi:serine/threonine protein kinase